MLLSQHFLPKLNLNPHTHTHARARIHAYTHFLKNLSSQLLLKSAHLALSRFHSLVHTHTHTHTLTHTHTHTHSHTDTHKLRRPLGLYSSCSILRRNSNKNAKKKNFFDLVGWEIPHTTFKTFFSKRRKNHFIFLIFSV